MDKNNLRIFSENVRRLIVESNKKRAEIAHDLGISTTTLQTYTTEKEADRKCPSLEKAMDIAKYFNVSLDWLCGLSEDRSNVPKPLSVVDICRFIVEMRETHKDLETNQSDWESILSAVNQCRINGLYDSDGNAVYGWQFIVQFPPFDELSDFFNTLDKIIPLLSSGAITQEMFDIIIDAQYKKVEKISGYHFSNKPGEDDDSVPF